MSETPEMKPISLDNLKRALYTLKNYFLQIKDAIRTVNHAEPDEYGNVQVEEVDFANELTSATTQRSAQAFVIRTTGGLSSDKDGDAWLNLVQGRSVKTGYVPESITKNITRAEGSEIDIEIDEDTFRGAMLGSGTITLTYTTEWSEDPATYGITVIGEPVNGDVIEVVYVMEDRGTISNATPSKFVSTGWNLFNPSAGAARVAKYDFGYRVDGTYTALKFSETFTGTQSAITVTDHQFDIPSDGYVWVEGSDEDTAIYPTWEDWTEGYEGSFETFADGYSYIDLSNILTNLFPYGMCSVGNVADEINLNVLTATQHIERMEYSDANLETVIASGAAYDTDENYIYYVNAEAAPVSIAESGIDGAFTASDHGIEYFEDTVTPAYCQTIYGASLKNKLERDVLTASQQTLTPTQKGQVQENLDVVPRSDHYVAFGTSASTIEQNLTTYWASMIPNTGDPVLVKINSSSGRWYGYLCYYDSKYGSGVITNYAGKTLFVYINNNVVTSRAAVQNVKEFFVYANSSKTFEVSNDARFTVFTFAAASALCGSFEVYSTGAGAIVNSNPTASSITVTKTTNSMTIANEGSVIAIVRMIVFDGDVT